MLKFHIPKDSQGAIKCTIHKSGKLGFSKEAINEMKIDSNKSVRIATNESDENDNNLYLVVEEGKKEDAFRIIKAGDYFYLNTKRLFDELEIDYEKNKIIYDVIDTEIEGMKVYKLKRREKSRQKE